MKKVINFDENKDIIDVNNINDYDSIGIKWSNDRKIMVIQMDEENFAGVSAHSLDASYTWRTKTKREYVVQALKQGAEVFKFENQKALLIWAIKEK